MQTGDSAPDFTAPTHDGSLLTLSALRGAPVVVYFYPKDDTPGCTTEAQDFTALGAAFAEAGARVIGVSKDTVAKHGKFAQKHGLGVTLVSDADSDICERYGVWGEKSNYGRTYMGITRTTVLIDAEGKVARIWPKVRVAGHAQAVLEAVRAL
ncbi:MAG: thioredoxin-dependent thiol peroxidase [Rhodobacter sp.]|uniref:thioredoxin-dependent thiol peroxidase n=1 Tax=Pararhodobacter sp. TaxID=2127056 RepID=UPI001DDE445B|nr:thioredoxin-dependent thiol peroxidase [Pararhodobacter sp.]MCB1346441.1 thioredoxin-dependent thiol peroxidase [Paracoccaceae bacterium]MCC0073937.1 thioredoxin-dependent thiol peroxidase [Rhodobacter sp.]HPD93048.1 thioredoxin-dependent thiol peroxidase [Pararhodobacter sp.]